MASLSAQVARTAPERYGLWRRSADPVMIGVATLPVILSMTTACHLMDVLAALDRISFGCAQDTFRHAQDAGASRARCSGRDGTEYRRDSSWSQHPKPVEGLALAAQAVDRGV